METMQYGNRSGRVVIRQPDPRYTIDLPARIVSDDRDPLPARLVNLSRHGCRVILPHSFDAAQLLRLEVPGWPRLAARVIWSQDGRTGCRFEEPPSPKVFAMMCSAAANRDRDDF
jgi:hypothetical protein